MYLHKTGGGTATQSAAQNVQSKTQPQAVKSAPPFSSPRSVSSLVTAAGLPQDKLSASIVSFARFFSLPLKLETLAAIRRQAFTPTTTQANPTAAAVQGEAVKQTAENTSEAGTAVKNREALSLAAAAAESKGVELQPKGLEAFAKAVDLDWQRRQENGEHQRGRRNKNENEQEEENAPSKTAPVTADGLKETALKSAEKDSLLDILNRLPGKNGQRWIMLPFNFRENDREFQVSLRILLDTEQANRAVLMALDCAEYCTAEYCTAEYSNAENRNAEKRVNENSVPEQRWLFVLETVGASADKMSLKRLTVHTQNELPQNAQSSLVREMSKLLDIPPERVFIKKLTESFPCESGGDDSLRAIDEAV